MAQFYTDFTGATVGADPPTGWTERWDATTNWRVGTGPVVEWEDGSTNRFDVLSWNTPGDVSGDIEVYGEFRSASGGGAQVGLSIQAQTGAVSGYFASLNFGETTFDEVGINRMDSGSENGIAAAAFLWTTGTTYSMRLRKFSADNIVRVRVWATAGSEPAPWNASSPADTTYSSGVVGLFARNQVGIKTWLKFGVGTAGDPAPTAPVSSGSLIRRDRRMGGGMGPLLSGGMSG